MELGLKRTFRSRSCCSLGIEEGRTSRHRTVNFYFLLSWNSSSRWITLTQSLKNVHDAEMFDVKDLHGDAVFVVEEVVSAAEETVNA
ncbi:hypothetical protein Tco_0292576, partial [Tanacetum coccineum]